MNYTNPSKLQAAILDWAGTVVDFGSFAPTQIFVEAFAELGSAVDAEGGLPVGSQRPQPASASVQPSNHGGEEEADQVPAMEFEIGRWHPHPCVLRQERDDGIDVVGLEGLGEATDQRLLGRRAWLGRRHALTVGDALLDAPPGPFEGGLHGVFGGAQHPRDLAGAKAENVPQDENRALARGQRLQSGDKGDFERLARLIPGLRAGLAIRGPLE